MASHAVTVVGAGVFGLAAAWELARRGCAVRVLEADHPGAGASGGTVGALAPHAPGNWTAMKQAQFDSLAGAEAFWSDVAAAGGIDPGYGRTGRIQPLGPDDLQRARDRAASAAECWQGRFALSVTDRPPEGAVLPHSPSGHYLIDDLTARLAPPAACRALAAAVQSAGGELVTGRRVDPAGEPLAGPVVWATGAPASGQLPDERSGIPGLRGVKGQSALLAFAAPDAPQIYAGGLHIVFHADGTTGVGSTSENSFASEGVDDALDEVLARARAVCPAIGAAPVIRRWAGIRARAPSRAPVVAAWPGRPQHFVLNGGFKTGFGMAPVCAAALADLVLDGRPPDAAFRLA